MAVKPKRAQAGKGQQQPARKSGRSSGRRTAKSEQEQTRSAAHDGNGQEALPRSAQTEQPWEQPWEEFTRAAREQVRRVADRGATPQVLGWTSAAPAKEFENMMTQFWNVGGDGGSGRYMRALAQANVEMVGLLGRRSRAYFDLPTHLAQCRSAQQMWDEQAKFFQDMLHDYQVANDRMMNCLMEIATPSTPEEPAQRARKS